jgi:hypothetical protein
MIGKFFFSDQTVLAKWQFLINKQVENKEKNEKHDGRKKRN